MRTTWRNLQLILEEARWHLPVYRLDPEAGHGVCNAVLFFVSSDGGEPELGALGLLVVRHV